MVEIKLDDLIQAVSLMSTVAGIIGSASALIVDFVRRRIRAKTAAYAAQDEFKRITSLVLVLQTTVETQIKSENLHHAEIRERVARLEGQIDSSLKP